VAEECVGDEVVTLYCYHHQVVCVLCARLLLTVKGLLTTTSWMLLGGFLSGVINFRLE